MLPSGRGGGDMPQALIQRAAPSTHMVAIIASATAVSARASPSMSEPVMARECAWYRHSKDFHRLQFELSDAKGDSIRLSGSDAAILLDFDELRATRQGRVSNDFSPGRVSCRDPSSPREQ